MKSTKASLETGWLFFTRCPVLKSVHIDPADIKPPVFPFIH
ncbi:hypothetical protein HMPREF1605_00308 [Escherichia coli 908521]|nr:hypothetical protein HMPREF1599_00124 [Escherichia coli 907713]ESD59388.1 hypothetical protein HMPREF1605_00308 [Escherichia coli 908521]KXG99913.1 hypothetical protein HMPREF3040_01842 [Escherichia coli]